MIVNAAAPRKGRATLRYISANDTIIYDIVPALFTPAPLTARPWRIVNLETVTLAVVLETVTIVLAPPPSMTVVLEPEPITFKLLPIMRFSV